MTLKRLPQTDSIQELAKFWDTHDLTDFQDQLEEVEEAVFERKTALTLQLPPNEAEEIHRIAKAQGLADSELIRQWVLEKIHAP